MSNEKETEVKGVTWKQVLAVIICAKVITLILMSMGGGQ